MSCNNKHADEERTIVIASSNQGKIRELGSLLGADYSVRPQSDFDVPPVRETGKSFVENAILKARQACQYSGLPAIADDSGLQVDALQGRPGVFSARYAGVDATDEENVDKLLRDLSNVPLAARSARFHCVIVFMRFAEDPIPLICEGTWHGHIQYCASGHGGFGYDPVFYVQSHQCSAAELGPDLKNKLSHRGQALHKLMKRLGSEPYFS